MSDKQPLIGTGPSAPPPYHPTPYGSAPAPQPPAYNPNVTVVTQVRPAQYHGDVELKPQNYVILSVITMLFFCWIFGLIALIISLQIDRTWQSGDREGAMRLSKQAKRWNIVGLAVGVFAHVCSVALIVTAGVLSGSS